MMAMVNRISIWGLMIVVGLVLWASSFLSLATGQSDERGTREAIVLKLEGAVTPTAADYLSREIAAASEQNKELIVIQIDTPGGLVTSMQSINKAILASQTPVATYVSPQGARSASAGLYIMYASHIAAMAPATNTGSATPIQLGGGGGPDLEPVTPEDATPAQESDEASENEGGADDLREAIETARPSAKPVAPPLSNDAALRVKIINDAVAYIQSLATLRERNAEWAEKAVREAANITATQALELNVIDIVAEDMPDLLSQINGRTVKIAGGEAKTINTSGIILTQIDPQLVEKILGFFADPNVAAILMSIGMLGLTVELWNPGSIFPGVVGFICLGLGLYAAQTLPFAWLGVWLIVGGVFLIVLEAYTPTLGLVGVIGLLVFGSGLYLLFPDTLRVSNTVIISTVALGGAFLAIILFALVGSRSHGPLIGAEAIKHREGYVDEWNGLEGYVMVEGERWQARSTTPLSPGDKIKVVQVEGLVLIVRQAKGPKTIASPMINQRRESVEL